MLKGTCGVLAIALAVTGALVHNALNTPIAAVGLNVCGKRDIYVIIDRSGNAKAYRPDDEIGAKILESIPERHKGAFAVTRNCGYQAPKIY